MGAVYRAFMKVARWYGRLVTSAATGFMAALALCVVGPQWADSRDRDQVIAVLVFLAVPLWILISVISYKLLKPKPDER